MSVKIEYNGQMVELIVSPYVRHKPIVLPEMSMPMYDYRCAKCDATKTEIMSLSEYDPTRPVICPNCHENMEREIAASPGMVFGYNANNGYSG